MKTLVPPEKANPNLVDISEVAVNPFRNNLLPTPGVNIFEPVKLPIKLTPLQPNIPLVCSTLIPPLSASYTPILPFELNILTEPTAMPQLVIPLVSHGIVVCVTLVKLVAPLYKNIEPPFT